MRPEVKRLLQNPPAGSKTRAALEYGVDLTLVTQNVFGKTPLQRLQELEQDQVDLQDVTRLRP